VIRQTLRKKRPVKQNAKKEKVSMEHAKVPVQLHPAKQKNATRSKPSLVLRISFLKYPLYGYYYLFISFILCV
jgi:hypothetical protein